MKKSLMVFVAVLLIAAGAVLVYSSFANPCNCSKPTLLDQIFSMSGFESKICRENTQIDSELEELKVKLETTANQGLKQTIDFELSSCLEEQKVVIRNLSDLEVCPSVCGPEKESCILLIYSNPLFQIKKCLNIPSDSVLSISGTDGTKTIDFALENAEVEISPGKKEITKVIKNILRKS